MVLYDLVIFVKSNRISVLTHLKIFIHREITAIIEVTCLSV